MVRSPIINPVNTIEHPKGVDRMNRFYRSQDTKWIAGVCGGLAEKWGINPLWIRLAFIVLTGFAVFPGVVIYGVLWLVLPVGPE